MFKTNFSGHNKIYGAQKIGGSQKIWGPLSPNAMPPVATGPGATKDRRRRAYTREEFTINLCVAASSL